MGGTAIARCAAVGSFMLLGLGLTSCFAIAATQDSSAQQCRAQGATVAIPGLVEASGIAISRSTPGRLWAHNDGSGQPELFALDLRGSVTARIRLSGVTVEDWEAIAVGPCSSGTCVYVGDIGDNNARRQRITVYRVEEPSGTEGSVAVKDVFHATYPDGPHDAETLLITPDGGLFIVTKGDTGPIAVYRFPRDLRSGATHQLERVGQPRGAGKTAASERITDGAISADGQWAVLRTNQSLTFHRTAELTAGNWREVRRVDLSGFDEPQGEGVALGGDASVYLAGEGGGNSRPGTFARFVCAPNS